MSASNEAAVCRREIVNGDGAGTVWFVRLPDGYLLDCGYGYKADERAAEITRRFSQTVMEWQPIATAPKTSLARLVWCPERQNIYVVSWWDNGRDEPGASWVLFGGGGGTLMEAPTHWMPLPEPPK
jgi:hypothetical protein